MVSTNDTNEINRREFVHNALLSAAALAVTPPLSFASVSSKEEVLAQIPLQHEQTVKMLRDWIALPSIAAENRGYPQGAEYMANLARDAGFQRVEIVPTAGKPGVFATLDAGAQIWLGIYFMYDVKQYDPAEWSSPPLEGRIIDRPGVGKVMMGRGATNQKGPEIAMLAALHAFKAAREKLPVNLVLVCEGEEEIGSPNFSQVVLQARGRGRASQMHRRDHPIRQPGSRRRRADQPRREGNRRAGARVHRREVGARAEGRTSTRVLPRRSTARRGISCRR